MAEVLDLKTLQKKRMIKKGSIVISAATEGNVLMVLHRGKIAIEHPMSDLLKHEMRAAGHPVDGVSSQMPIGFVGKNQYFGWETFMPRSESFPVLRCVEESEVSIYPCALVEELIKKSPLAFTAIIRSMSHNLNYFVSYNNKIVALINQIVEANFKLAILFKKLNLTLSNEILKKYLEMAQPDYDYLQMSRFISAVPDFTPRANRFNLRDTSLLDAMYQVELRENVVQMLTKQPVIGRFSFETILREFTYIYKFIKDNLDLMIEEFLVLAYGKTSFLKQLTYQQEKIDIDRWHGLISLAWEHYNERFFTNFLIKRIFNIDDLRRAVVIQKESIEGAGLSMAEENVQNEDFDDVLAKEERHTQEGRIFAKNGALAKDAESRAHKVSEVLAETGASAEMDLKRFMSSEDMFVYKRPRLSEELIETLMRPVKPKEDLTPLKKSARVMNSIYFKALERAAAMLYIDEVEDKEATQLLRYGIINVKLLTQQQLGALMSFEDTTDSHYDIIRLEEWLERIATDKEEPSNDQLGFTFDKFMAGKVRFLSENAKRQLEERSPEEKRLSRLSFEINSMIATVYKMMNFSVSSTVIHVMSKTNLPDNMENITILTKKMITDLVDEILGYDHLLFYREALFQVSKTKNHIIEVGVFPKFIIVPAVGSKVIFWQEIVGTQKKSPARFVLPMVFLGDIRKTMIIALGNFRWEINRAVKGVSWMNPVDGGLTGHFVDYLMFYKKRSSLSFEAKEKIAKFIKNNRNNARNMFSTLYYEWIEFERKGLVRLNSEERKIMFLFVPFANKIRESLKNFPIYRDLIKIHNLRANREIERFSKHYAHLKDEAGKFPDEVEKYITSRVL